MVVKKRKVTVLTRHVELGKGGKAVWGRFKVARYRVDPVLNIRAAIDVALRYVKRYQIGTIIYTATSGGEAVPVYQVKWSRDGTIYRAWYDNPAATYWQRMMSQARTKR